MKYQDSWLNGKVIEKGGRECAKRYEIIKGFCETLPQPFSVLDIGSNMNYFGLRLTSDFNCRVVAFEFHQFEMRAKLVRDSGNKRLMFLKRKLQLEDMETLAACAKFDLVLALSVIHHLPGSISEWIKKMRIVGRSVILEVALSDSKLVSKKKEYLIPEDAVEIGGGESHLEKGFVRPIYFLKGAE